MIAIKEAKQVGNVSYMVGDLEVLCNIIATKEIWTSQPEYNAKQHKNMPFVSLARDMVAATLRNPKRWKYGIILDGNKLSNKYSIEPFSYAGMAVNKGDKFKVKILTHYDDNTYALTMVNWPTITISQKLFQILEDYILNMPQDKKEQKRLEIKDGGHRKVNGHKIVKQYLFNVPSGGFVINANSLPAEYQSLLIKHEKVNETEERIWTNASKIDISGSIVGVILPKEVKVEFESMKVGNVNEDDPLQTLKNEISKVDKDYIVKYY